MCKHYFQFNAQFSYTPDFNSLNCTIPYKGLYTKPAHSPSRGFFRVYTKTSAYFFPFISTELFFSTALLVSFTEMVPFLMKNELLPTVIFLIKSEKGFVAHIKKNFHSDTTCAISRKHSDRASPGGSAYT
jgi:hypothetical protein